MKLNKESKDELRLMIEQKLQNVSNGERLHIDKELLEELLFDELVYNKNTGATLKLPIWSGEFLSKIDLSEISFDNVAWSLIGSKDYDCGGEDLFDIDVWDKFNNGKENGIYLNDGEYVNYKNTNAKIDFTKSWEFKVYGAIMLVSCNFSGLNLSNLDMSKVHNIHSCILDNTNIKMPPMDKVDFFASDSSFLGINLSNYVLDADKMLSRHPLAYFDIGCILKYTGINIVNYNKSDWEFDDALNKGNLEGCYINGKLFNSSSERDIVSQEKKMDVKKNVQELDELEYKNLDIKIRLENESIFSKRQQSYKVITRFNKMGVYTVEDFINADVEKIATSVYTRKLYRAHQEILKYKYLNEPLIMDVILDKNYFDDGVFKTDELLDDMTRLGFEIYMERNTRERYGQKIINNGGPFVMIDIIKSWTRRKYDFLREFYVEYYYNRKKQEQETNLTGENDKAVLDELKNQLIGLLNRRNELDSKISLLLEQINTLEGGRIVNGRK